MHELTVPVSPPRPGSGQELTLLYLLVNNFRSHLDREWENCGDYKMFSELTALFLAWFW